MKKTFLLITVILISCNQNNRKIKQPKADNIKSMFYDSSAIDSLDLKDEYFIAKWWLFCQNCDKVWKYRNRQAQIDTNITFGTLPLEFDSLKIGNDTDIFYMTFRYLTNVKISVLNSDNDIETGVMIKKSTKKVIAFMSNTSASTVWNTSPKSRFVNPLQPEVIDYIIKNKNKLNPWFKNEAIKKGVLKE